MTTPTISQLFDLTGKAVIVTGGGRGIGQAGALRLAEAGADVMVMDVNLQLAEETVKQIRASGGNAQAIQADVSSVADASRVVKACVNSFGHLDILYNNAAILPMSPALEVTEELWDSVQSINLKGMFFYSQAAAREMIRAGNGGRIINMSSSNALRPRTGASSYSISKAGVVMLTKSLALEWAPHKILVNAIAPAGIPTPGTLEGRTRGDNIDEETAIARSLQRRPLGRLGDTDEIAKIVLFLASSASDYITGTVLVADGGNLLT